MAVADVPMFLLSFLLNVFAIFYPNAIAIATGTAARASKSAAASVINTVDVPVRFKSEPVELDVKVLLKVVPECVYVPVPIS